MESLYNNTMKRPLLLALGAVMVFSAVSPAFARGNKRKSRKAKPRAETPALDAPIFTSFLEVTGSPEPDLRDAPAALPAPVAAPAPLTLVERLAAERNSGIRRIDVDSCRDGARNLRFIVSVAKSDLQDEDATAARRKFASGLKRELDIMHRSQPAEDSEVAVLATEAEMELEAALKELEDRPLRAGTLAAASRAAANLDAAARLLATR